MSGWEYPLQRSFERAITPDKPTASPIPTLMDDGFGQVARALRDGASGPEAFALFLRLSSGHFDRVDLGAGYKKLHNFRVPNGTPVSYLVENFASLYRQRQAQSVLWSQGLILF